MKSPEKEPVMHQPMNPIKVSIVGHQYRANAGHEVGYSERLDTRIDGEEICPRSEVGCRVDNGKDQHTAQRSQNLASNISARSFPLLNLVSFQPLFPEQPEGAEDAAGGNGIKKKVDGQCDQPNHDQIPDGVTFEVQRLI
jgi:hypothetical protein